MLFSGSTSAMNASMPCAAARCASCSSSRVPMPLPLELVRDRERRLGRLRVAEAHVVPDADDALVGRVAHDADERSLARPSRARRSSGRTARRDGEAVEAEEAAADGELGEERHDAGTSASVGGRSRSVVPSRRMTSTAGSAGWARSIMSLA